MKIRNYGYVLENEDGDVCYIVPNADGYGWVLRVGQSEFWIDNLDEFLDQLTKASR